MHDCSLLLWQHAIFIKLMSRCNAWWVKMSCKGWKIFKALIVGCIQKMVEHAYRQQCCASRLHTYKAAFWLLEYSNTSGGFDGFTSAVSHEFSCKDLKWYNTLEDLQQYTRVLTEPDQGCIFRWTTYNETFYISL